MTLSKRLEQLEREHEADDLEDWTMLIVIGAESKTYCYNVVTEEKVEDADLLARIKSRGDALFTRGIITEFQVTLGTAGDFTTPEL